MVGGSDVGGAGGGGGSGGGGGAARRRTAAAASSAAKSKWQHRPKEVVDAQGVPLVVGRRADGGGVAPPWTPSLTTAFKLVLSIRLSAAIWSNISDCDETYNYWEPVHYMLYGKGFQTWEYSPEFALRSYLYILVHALPAKVYAALLQPNKMYVFYFVRCLLAVVCSAAEVYFFRGVCREIGANVGRITLACLVLSSGMFTASTALLPSTTSMYLCLVAYGAWFSQAYELSILATAVSALLSWPFAAILGVPIAVDVTLRQRKWRLFFVWSVVSAAIVLVPQIIVDREYYGRLIIAPLNIVCYNVFTSHGPDIYGTEPWHFYLVNGFLNFNLIFFLSLGVAPCLALVTYCLSLPHKSRHFIPNWLIHLGLYLWLAIFFLQPHKEERFLFPVYPLICLAGAAAIDGLQKLFFYFYMRLKNQHYLDATSWFSVGTLAVFGMLSLSRSIALFQNYHAPTDVWIHINHLPYSRPDLASTLATNGGTPAETENKVICIGKEWHRFPTSFFIPTDMWELEFLKSEFRGQLPRHFEAGKNATKLISTEFNDANREEFGRYRVSSVEQCDFLVDLETETVSDLEPKYSSQPGRWEVEKSVDFLDAANSHRLLRAFFVPFLSRSRCRYLPYVLLRNVEKLEKTRTEAAATAEKLKLKKKIRHL